MKLEPHDDGYETSADMLLNNPSNMTHSHNHDVKCEKLEDPYSFIDDDPMPMLPVPQGPPHLMHQHPHTQMPPINTQQLMPGPKKRGRKKKIKPEQPEFNQDLNGGIPRPIKERKKHDRFNGMPEEEVSKRTLPDHLTENLDIIIIGINPGLFAAYKGHHYAGPGNHFWKCLYLAGLTPQQMSADEDYKLLQVGIGFTNMVSRATKGSADLTRKEIKEGSQILLEKLRKFRPKIAVFNGKLIYEVFSGKKDFKFGRQPDLIEGTNTHMWVMPSSSARCAQLPRAADKVPFYAALKKFRDYLNGVITEIDENEMVFSEPRVKSCYEAEPKPDPFSTDITDISNAVIKNEDGTIIPCKKKRGRPKKIKVEGEEPPPKPVVRKPPQIQNNNCDFPKKKRGRPKKVKVENLEMTPSDNTSTNMSQCYSNQSPIQSPNTFYQMGPALTPPNSTSNLYAPQPTPYTQSPRPPYSQSPRPPYSQSPRPHSQPFTHSDLSSEISAAISSEQLGSPASPMGPLDFEPPTSMAEEAECRLGSPAPSSNSEQPHYPYHSYNMDPPQEPQYPSPRQNQDIASKSLSGLESLVDQIPSITEGEAQLGESPEQYSGQFNTNYNVSSRASPVPYNYPPSSGYPLYPTPTWSGHYEAMPPLAYPQLPYAQGYGPAGIHVPSPNYPYYSYPQPAPTHPPGYPPYLGGF
ncbi:arginine-glutamic acid dipeptide repeats protein isoform X2 [Aethina tumida]|nr:arginine-glutamic acid dipeptide repeats protein isoform X2 [Aethina tumida]XP_019873462.2 arginine-glutamic acid dipeptide repeats protein isoform X2 [Aethina tumida]XP_049826504.1 arginine-glutamic acid dipeptide repeats protein isoform X2 [Aethina tumida]